MNHRFDRGVRNVGFVSTRVSGTDGVSLEIGKWAEVLQRMGYDCHYICGKSDRPADRCFLIEEADFRHPSIETITRRAFGGNERTRTLSDQIHQTFTRMKGQLYAAIEQFRPDVLIAQNALTIPLNIPLGLALVQVLLETGIPCIAHHHDFAWERERFLVNCVPDYLRAAFPPSIAGIDHVVINSLAGEEMSRRTGQQYRIIPNVMDFAQPPEPPDEYAQSFRSSVGVADDDLLILQPTRVVARKGIEHSIELVRRLQNPRCKLVITHGSNDEGPAYLERIREFAKLLGVEVIFAHQWISDQRGVAPDGRKLYTIWDVYPLADLVTYPSTYEGFGNAFVEAVYFKKPIFCNRYTIYRTDIEPCGFQSIVMDGFLTDEVVEDVQWILNDSEARTTMVEHNYKIAKQYFSYERLERELRDILLGLRPRVSTSR